MNEDDLPKSLIMPKVTVRIPIPEGAAVPPQFYPTPAPLMETQPENS